MQVVILAGGLGTRISQESNAIPKPLVEIGGIPIIFHIMNYFSQFGHNKFCLLLGYKSEKIKDFFIKFNVANSNLKLDLASGNLENLGSKKEINWEIDFIETGLETMTGGRLLQAKDYLESQFFLTYGDGLANVDLAALLDQHEKSGRIGTVTAVNPPSRYGALKIEDDRVMSFDEKPDENNWINGGFFIFNKQICEFIDSEDCILERGPLERLVSAGELSAFKHRGFWLGMDTVRDREILEKLWNSKRAPWVVSA